MCLVFLSFLYPKIENWVCVLIIKVIYSLLENSKHTENQITCGNHTTTENQLTRLPPTHPRIVFFGCFSHGWGKGLSVDSQSPTIWEAYSLKIKSKNLKASFVTGTFPIHLLFYLLCSVYRPLVIYITVRPFHTLLILQSILNDTKWFSLG